MKGLRQATVEPVLGTLINFMELRKINTRGIKQALKGMLLAASAYNLQKLLRFIPKTRQSAMMALPRPIATTLLKLFYQQKLLDDQKKVRPMTSNHELCNSYPC